MEDRRPPSGSDDERESVALLLVDVINDLEFEGGARLLEEALPAAERLRTLVDRAREAGVPIVYANDNFGHWRDDFPELLRHCLEDGVRGEPIARMLEPAASDYFILKPRHSAFFLTPLEYLLDHLEVEELIVAGLATDQCVQVTAADAHMRGYRVTVPRDCSAAETEERHRRAMEWMERMADADTGASEALKLPSSSERVRAPR